MDNYSNSPSLQIICIGLTFENLYYECIYPIKNI